MGTILSSNKDYNRTLARQPPKPIQISEFHVPDNLQQHPLTSTLSIPAPVRNTQSNHQPPVTVKDTTQSTPPPAIKQQLPLEKPLIARSSSFTLQPNFSITNPVMNRDPVIVSRSVINLNNNNDQSFRSNRSIVQRNGKQFVTELKHRMERRYVQVFDDTTGQMRFFEVTDYIPSRVVRSMTVNPQFQSQQNGLSHQTVRPNFSMTHHLPLPPRANSRRQSAMSSNLVGFTNNRIPVPNTNNESRPPQPALTAQNSIDSTYSYPQPQPQPQAYNPSTAASYERRNQYTSGSQQYQPTSFRLHSPTATDDSVTESETHSINSDEDSDEEGIDPTSPPSVRRSNTNRNDVAVSYGTLGGRDSSSSVDLFKRPINSHNPYYRRGGLNNYTEPVINGRGYQITTANDYAPIPLSHKQTNQNPYSYRRQSNAYDG